jgi:hypothetical protein
MVEDKIKIQKNKEDKTIPKSKRTKKSKEEAEEKYKENKKKLGLL